MKTFFYLLFAVMLVGCSEYRTVTYKEIDPNSSYPKENIEIQLTIPKGYKRVREYVNHSIEHRYYYSDSSIIFISNSLFSGASINSRNRSEKGYDFFYRKHYHDTIRAEGTDKETFWREVKFDNVSVGYLNVSTENKAKFDIAVDSIKRKKK